MYKPSNLLKMDTKTQAESQLRLQRYFFSLWILQSKVNSNNFIGRTKAPVITELKKKKTGLQCFILQVVQIVSFAI